MTLYWRDRLDVITYLYSNPVFANSMENTPYTLIDTEENIRAYGEFMSGRLAWEYQVRWIALFLGAH
jgi:hypothetical protein